VSEIRISCVGLCRIQDDKQRYLLGLNKNRLQKNTPIFMPLGGSFQYDPPALLDRWDAHSEKQNQDLRFFAPLEQVDHIRDWFCDRAEREVTPFRELQEEIVDEYNIVSALTERDVEITFAKLVELERFTNRSGVTGLLTHYFIEVFDVTFTSPMLLKKLHQSAFTHHLYWITRDEIKKRKVMIDDTEYVVDADLMLDD